MVNTNMSLSWFRFPSDTEPEAMISLQVVPRSNKKRIFPGGSIYFFSSAQ